MAAPRAPFNVTALNIEVPADGQREVTFSVATGVLDDTWTVEIAGTTVAEGDGTDSFVAVFPASADGQRWQLSHEGIERVAGVVIPRPLRNALDLTTLELTVDDGGTVIDIEVVAVGPVGPPGVVAATGIATYDDLTQTIDVPMPTAADVGAATAAQGATADTAVQPGDLASVATTGDYDDLTGKPTLGTAAAEDVTDFASAAQGVLAGTAVQPGDLSAVATSGVYADLSGAPSIPNDPGDIGAATAAQGALADTSLQPDDIGSSVQAHAAVLDGTTASFTTADETKLDGIAAGAEVNVQSDWLAGSGDAAILNKPALGTAAAADTGDFASAAQGSTADTAVQPGDLADVATSGDGADVAVDLTDYLPAVTADNAQDGLHQAWEALFGVSTTLGDLYGEIGDANTTIGLVSDAAAAADEILLDLANHAITQAASRIPRSVRFSATAVPAQTVTAADRIGAGLHTWPDGNIGFANLSGTIYAFAPNGPDSARNTATTTNLRGTVQQTALALSTIEPADYAAGGDVYVDTGTGKIIKLWHGEIQGVDPMNFRSFHGLAVASTGSPDAWTDLGRIITPADGLDPADGTHDLANNSMLVYGSHMYVFFSERTASTRGAFSVARAPLADVITWANGGAPATFLKYHLGAWTEPGIGGDSTEVMPGAPYPAWGSVIRVSGLADRFVMVWTAKLSPVGIEGNQWAVYAAMSEPGSLTSWGEPELIIGPTPSAALYYPTLADATDLSTHVSDATTMKLYLVSSAAGAIGSNPWADAEVLVYDLTIYNGRTDTQGGLSRWFDGINDVNPVTAFGSFLGSAALGFGPASGALDILFLRASGGVLVMQLGSALKLPKLRLDNLGANPAGPNVVGDLAVVSGVLKICTAAGTPGTWANV